MLTRVNINLYHYDIGSMHEGIEFGGDKPLMTSAFACVHYQALVKTSVDGRVDSSVAYCLHLPMGRTCDEHSDDGSSRQRGIAVRLHMQPFRFNRGRHISAADFPRFENERSSPQWR